MDYRYLGYTTEPKKVVTGTVAAASADVASGILNRRGYQVLSLKPVRSFSPHWEKWFPSLFQVKPGAIIMFSRQLALLLEAGTDIITSLELLQAQVSQRVFKRVLGEAIAELRSGNRLSVALSKHPEIFPPIYSRSLNVGEQTGTLETVLRQIADYLEKRATAKKGVKSALAYPLTVSLVAVVVVLVLVTFVLPAFMDLYRTLGTELPPLTRMLISLIEGLRSYGFYLLTASALAAIAVATYIKTPRGRYQWDRLAFRLPLVGWINHLQELARCCHTIAVLFRGGLPLMEIMNIVINGSGNKVMVEALTGVQQAMSKGEGLSQPMSQNPLFLPMMVQMVKVGEETGNLDVTLLAIAQNYETEADDRTHSLIGFIQPAMTLVIGAMVSFITLSLLSAMYAVYGQIR